MEKKTIGKFISALRRANGMTQKELGEKLFVSDKTVSRWERDECTPELSLIPVIAEIFGITTDELLRGERNSQDGFADAERIERQKAKSDRQFRFMLNKKYRSYKNLTLISVGLTLLGIITAAIINLGFSKGLIAFCVAVAFCIASEICQVCFAVNARIITDETDIYKEKIEAFNTSIVTTAVKLTLFNILTFAFCLPLVTVIDGANFGLPFGFWVEFGALFAFIGAVISYIAYELFVKKLLLKSSLIVLTDMQKETMSRSTKLLKKTLSVFGCIALALIFAVVLLNIIVNAIGPKKYVFDNCEDFKAFVQNDYDRWYEEGYSYKDENGNVVFESPVIELYPSNEEKIWPDELEAKEYPKKIYSEIRNSKGEIICEYYYNPDLYYSITFTEFTYDKMPVTVITMEDHYAQTDVNATVESLLYLLICVDIVLAIVTYVIKLYKLQRSA